MQYMHRLRALQSLLRAKKLPALLLTTPANIRYLTGVDASEGLLVVQPMSASLFVDSRYLEVARTFRTARLKVLDRSDLQRLFPTVKRCGFEEHHLTAGRLKRFQSLFKNTKFVHTSGLTEGLRRKKDPDELRLMKRALAITDDVLRLIPRLLKPGMTETMLAGKILLACLERGAEGFAFDPIVAFGSNSSRPHHHTGARRLRRRDIVQIDIGARYKGYCSDRSEVFFVGEPTSAQRRVYAAVHDAKEAAKKWVKNGASTTKLDDVARKILRAQQLDRLFTHALGHGVGLEIHEGVTISAKAPGAILETGEVVTIEPGVYIAGKFGIRLEDTVFVR